MKADVFITLQSLSDKPCRIHPVEVAPLITRRTPTNTLASCVEIPLKPGEKQDLSCTHLCSILKLEEKGCVETVFTASKHH